MKFFKKSDLIIIGVILLVAFALSIFYRSWNSDRLAYAEIYYNSELVQTVDLNAGIDKTFKIPQEDHVIIHQYQDGSIRFEESDCPDKVCIRAGKLSVVGESATCLPNKITIKVVPKDDYNEDDVDIIVGN